MKMFGGGVVVLLAVVLGCPVGSAATVTYDFASLSSGSPPYPTTRTFTNDGLVLTLTALGQNAGSSDVKTEGVSLVTGKGVGVKHTSAVLSSDIDAISDNPGPEELIFTFNQDVIFKSIVFSDQNNDFAGSVFFLLNASDFGDFNGTGNRIAYFNGLANSGAGNPQYQGLPNYVFPANKAGPKSVIEVYVANANTGVYVSSLTVEPTPIPGAAWLFGSGLIGLLGMATLKRRRLAL